MKTLRNIILVVITIITYNVFGYDMCVDGIYYNKLSDGGNNEKRAEVTYFNLFNNTIYNHYVGDIIIPDTIVVKISTTPLRYATYHVIGIGQFAFAYSHGLVSITLPSTIQSIGYGAFEMDTNITHVVFKGKTPPIIGGTSISGVKEIYVPCGCINTYVNSSIYWKAYSAYIMDTMLYTISGMSSDISNGTVEVGNISCSTTITAKPNSHYHFTRWTDGNTDNPRLIENINNDTIFVAVFAVDTYKVVVIYDSYFGTVSGAGNYVYNDTVTMTATPTPHNKCKFDKWNDGDTNAKRSFIISQDTTFTANFILDDTKVTTTDYNNNITVYPNPTNDKLFIESNNIVINKVEVFNVIGKCIYTGNNSTIDLGQYENGMYIIRLTTPEGNIIKRVIKG